MYKVVLVDDEQNIREGIQELLDWESLRCEVVKAFRNGGQVIEYLKEHEVDIIVTDIRMPIVDGLMLAKHIYENKIPVEVIFLTAFSEFEYAQKAIKYKVADFVIKNDFLVELPQVIKKVADKLEAKNYDLKGAAGESLIDVRGKYLFCMGEVKNGYKLDVSKKIADLEKVMRVSICSDHIFLFYNDEVSFYIIIENSEMINEDFRQLKKSLKKFIALARDFLQLELRLGISNVMEAEEGVFRGKKQAVQALGEVIGQEDNIQFYSEIKEKKAQEDNQDIDHFMRQLLRAIKEKDAEAVQEKEEEFKAYMRAADKLVEQYKSDTHAIASYLLRKYRSLYPDKEALFIKESIFETIYLAKSKAALIDIMHDVCETMKEMWGEEVVHKNVLVDKVNEIIRNNYQSKLSLKEISQKLFVSGSYLSRVYKKETGETITDAINKYRIQCAKELLASQNYKIYEVANLVGIDDSAYFTHIFYKYEEETPSGYMNRYNH